MKNYRDEFIKFTFVIPALLCFLLVVVVPFIRGFTWAFTNWDGTATHYEFIGFHNLVLLFRNGDIWQSFGNTIVFTVITTVLANSLGLIMALLLNFSFRGITFIKSAIFLPVVISLVIASIIWVYVYSDIWPLVFGMRGLLGNASTVMVGLSFIAVWKEVGLLMVIYYAGLQTIPKDVYESASLDCNHPIQLVRHITLPLLMPAFTYCIPFTIAISLKMFDYSMVATQGGPGRASETLALYVYNYEFPYFKAGYGQMSALVLLAFIFVVTISVTRFFRKREVEY